MQKNEKTELRLRKPYPQHWFDISSGSSSWHIALTLNSLTKKMACEVYISGDKDLYKRFEAHKTQIEKHLGDDLEWMELPNKKASRIKQSAPCDIKNKKKWPEYFTWLLYRAESFRKTFGEL